MTEREFIEDEGGTARNVLEAIQAWGAKVALDDFGTGFSNIATLRRFRLDHLKIDRSFVEGIGTGSVAETVIDAIVDLGQKLEMTIIAEGVERPEQVDYLVARGVHLIQGFHFSLPLTLKGLVRFVEARAAQAAESEAAEVARIDGRSGLTEARALLLPDDPDRRGRREVLGRLEKREELGRDGERLHRTARVAVGRPARDRPLRPVVADVHLAPGARTCRPDGEEAPLGRRLVRTPRAG